MNNLIKIELNILKLYKLLLKLDIKRQKNNIKYKNILSELKKLIKQEEELLESPKISNISEEEYEEIIENASLIDEAVGIRIMTRLTGILIKNMCEQAGERVCVIADKITEEVQTNIMLFYIKYLYELIKKEKDELFRIHLLAEFYDSCYIEPRVGNLLLDDYFEVRDDYFKSCYFAADLFGINRNDVQKLVDESCLEFLLPQIIENLFVKDNSINIICDRNKFGTLSCMVKAVRTIMSEDAFDGIDDLLLTNITAINLCRHPNYNLFLRLLSDETKPEKVTTITYGKPLRKIKDKKDNLD